MNKFMTTLQTDPIQLDMQNCLFIATTKKQPVAIVGQNDEKANRLIYLEWIFFPQFFP